jgi:hypothetical protein
MMVSREKVKVFFFNLIKNILLLYSEKKFQIRVVGVDDMLLDIEDAFLSV